MSPVAAVAVVLVGFPIAPRLDADGFPFPSGAAARFRSGELIERLMYSPDGRFLASEGHQPQSAARCWGAATGQHLLRFGGGNEWAQVLRFGPGPTVTVAFHSDRLSLQRVAIPTGHVLATVKIPAARRQFVWLSRDGTRVAYTTAD